MATALLHRRSTTRGLIALIQQQIQPYLQTACQFHTSDHIYSAETVISGKTSGVKSYDEIPGPSPLPIIGNIWRFLPYIGEYSGIELSELHRIIYNQYGPIVKIAKIPGVGDMLFVFRPEDMEVVFRNEGPWPIRAGMQSMVYYRNVFRKDFYKNGGGVLIEQGEKWFKARSKANQPMMQPRISKRYIQPIAGVAEEFVQKMRAMKDDKDEMPEDFINELFKWSLESIAYVALDKRLGCLAANLKSDSEPQRMINAVGDFFECLFYLEIGLPVWKVFPTPAWKKFVKALDLFLEVSVKYVDEAIERTMKRKAEGNADTEPSVLERLLERGDSKSACIMAQDMLFGGVDTTSYSVAMSMYQLSKNPEKQEMLYKELKRVLPSKNDPITEETLENLKYLKACIKESSRTLPILSGNLRTTTKDIILSNYKVPKGVWAIMPSTISRQSDEYFPLSKKYIPERWLKNRPTDDTTGCPNDFDAVSKRKSQPFAFIPFGFGPRSCIGKRFADLEMEILLAKIIRNFHIEYNYKDLTFLNRILNTPKEPLRFKVTERKE